MAINLAGKDEVHTFPSLAKCFSSSLFVTRGDNPVTYRLLPGFSTEGLLQPDQKQMKQEP